VETTIEQRTVGGLGRAKSSGVKSQRPEWAEYVVRVTGDRPVRLVLDSHR